METLTDREKEVASLVSLRLRNKEIATHLSITEKTVKNHVWQIAKKLQCKNRLEILAKWQDRK